MAATRRRLATGRWHFQHGPIDCVIDVDGRPAAVAEAQDRAWRRFATILDELVAELPLLKRAVGEHCPLAGPVARRMWLATAPYRARFITPMAAVAGSVAEELIGFYDRPGIARAWINNGGDIAVHLGPGQRTRIGIVVDRVAHGHVDIAAPMPVRGVATSGWRGRSFSLGIADSVTVLASTAARADAAATVIGNSVDVDDPRIVRRPASSQKDDSDLGDLPVTVDVPLLGEHACRQALDAGLACAERLRSAGLVHGAVLVCQGRSSATGALWPQAVAA